MDSSRNCRQKVCGAADIWPISFTADTAKCDILTALSLSVKDGLAIVPKLMKWILYNALFAVAYTVMLPSFLLRMKRRGGYRARFTQPPKSSGL